MQTKSAAETFWNFLELFGVPKWKALEKPSTILDTEWMVKGPIGGEPHHALREGQGVQAESPHSLPILQKL